MALHRDCEIADQLEAAFVAEVLDFITQKKTSTAGLEDLSSQAGRRLKVNIILYHNYIYNLAASEVGHKKC